MTGVTASLFYAVIGKTKNVRLIFHKSSLWYKGNKKDFIEDISKYLFTKPKI